MPKNLSYEELTRRLEQLEDQLRASRHLEDARRESDARYFGVFEYSKNGVAVYRAIKNGKDFIFVDFNKAAEQIDKIKKEEVIGRSILEVFPGVKAFGFFDILQKVWASGEPAHLPVSEYRDERIAGWRDNFVYKVPSGEVVAVYSDETERKQAEEALRKAHDELQSLSTKLEQKVEQRTRQLEKKNQELIEAERLAVLGKMAERVAHDLRNSLTVIGGFARRLHDKASADDPNKPYLKRIFDEVTILEQKVSEIIKLENIDRE
jgi:nitrogen fixation/metabolism regulation signal transduction histidine kinase